MVQHIRLAALAAAFFVIAYAIVAWALAGSPRPTFKPGPSAPSMRVAVAPARIDADRVPAREANPRDRLRLAAMQASEAYAAAPCDGTAKAGMIEAISAYAKAWHDMMGCGPNGCDRDKLNTAASAFSTPLDMRVREAVGAAFDKRGISIDDFPAALRINVAMLARGRGDSAAACPETRAQAGVSR